MNEDFVRSVMSGPNRQDLKHDLVGIVRHVQKKLDCEGHSSPKVRNEEKSLLH